MTSSPSIKLLPTGAILQEFLVAGHNLVLNFNTEASYTSTHNPSHFGATIGRVANRIKNAEIASLSGQAWSLGKNDGHNNLHGGEEGWGKRVFSGPETKLVDGKEAAVFKYLSKHLEEGFPGDVEVTVAYKPSEDAAGKVRVEIDLEARLVGGSEETCVNLTNHSYFNLSGNPTIAGTIAQLASTTHLPLDPGGIPLSTPPASYPGLSPNTPFTLTAETDIDDCFIFSDIPAGSVPLDTRTQPERLCAKFHHPETKLNLEVLTTEPSFQFYTGKYVDVPAQADGTPQRVRNGGFCVEPGRYVDAVNREEWKGQVVLKKGEVYGSKIVYVAWKGEQ